MGQHAALELGALSVLPHVAEWSPLIDQVRTTEGQQGLWG